MYLAWNRSPKKVNEFFNDESIDLIFSNITEVEWIVAKTGAIKTTLEEDPRKQMYASRKFYQKYDSEDSD